MDGLTRKQRVWLEAYLTTWNATEAARQAGYKHPDRQGPRLLGNVVIRAAIEARMAEKAMGANEVLTRLAQQARASIGDFIEYRILERAESDGSITEIEVFAPVWDAIKRQGHLVKKISQGPNGFTVELYDAQAALVHIGKNLRLFAEKVELSNPDGSNLIPVADLVAALRQADAELSDAGDQG